MDKDEIIAAGLIVRQILLFRFTAWEEARVLRLLKTMEEELIELLFFSGKPLTDISRADKARLLAQAQTVINASYGTVSDTVAANLTTLGGIEATATAASLEQAFQSLISPALPTETVLKMLVRDTMIQGAPSAEWWSRQAGDVRIRFTQQVSQGLAQAEGNAQIISRIRGKATSWKMVEGKRVYDYTGGIMQIARHHAAAQVQTSVQTVANAARRETFEANDDIVKGVRQVSTLDSHTTPACVAYSGAGWSLPGYVPIAPNKLPYNGGTPRHWNCRSVETPITKTFRELGIDLPEFEGSTRASTSGPVAASTTFKQFIDDKPKAFADDLLGKGKADLYRAGKITLPQLLDQTGRPLTLAQLRKLYG